MSAFHMLHPTAALYRKFNIMVQPLRKKCYHKFQSSAIETSNRSDSREMGVNESVKSIHSRDSTYMRRCI